MCVHTCVFEYENGTLEIIWEPEISHVDLAEENNELIEGIKGLDEREMRGRNEQREKREHGEERKYISQNVEVFL